MAVFVLVVGILAVVALIQAAIWIPLVARWRRRNAEFWSAFDDGCARGDESVAVPREKAIYRGGTGDYSQVRGNGLLTLTSRRLLVRKYTGGVVEIAVEDICGAHRSKGFNGAIVGNKEHLVVETCRGPEVAFFVGDTQGWLDRLQNLSAR